MRLIQRPWLLALVLCTTAPLALGSGCSKDEEVSVEADEADPEAAVAGDESATEEAESAEAEEGDEEAEDDEGNGEPSEAAEAPTKDAASPTPRGRDKKAEAKAAPVARADKARDRIAKAKDGALDKPAKTKDDAPATAPATEEGAPPADDGAALLSPAERRKAERERRIAELKRRNEERRKERMSKVDEQRREAEAVAKQAPAPPARPAAPSAPKGLDLAKYVTQAQVRKLTGNDTLVEEGRLAGIEPGDRYNSVYYAPPVRSSFGLSVQVWRDKTRRDANVRFRRMRSQYANAEDATSPTAKSFFSQWDDILTLSFADLKKRTVVSVSCSMEICKPDKLLDVAKSIKGKL